MAIGVDSDEVTNREQSVVTVKMGWPGDRTVVSNVYVLSPSNPDFPSHNEPCSHGG